MKPSSSTSSIAGSSSQSSVVARQKKRKTSGEDGLLRAVSILPNKIVAILGDPLEVEDDIFTGEVSVSHCRNFLASCAHDDMVKIYDVSHLAIRPKDEEFDLEAYECSV